MVISDCVLFKFVLGYDASPDIVSDIKSLLAPIKEGRAPTAEEWQAAEAVLDAANAKVQAE